MRKEITTPCHADSNDGLADGLSQLAGFGMVPHYRKLRSQLPFHAGISRPNGPRISCFS